MRKSLAQGGFVILILSVIALLGSLPTRSWRLDMPEVDTALILAVDVSYSVDADRFALQKRGYVDAFRSREVHKAISSGSIGAVAVTFVTWSGIQEQVVDWYIVKGAHSANHFAEAVHRVLHHSGSGTNIAGAISFGVKLFDKAPFRALRRVIDVSGDGADNGGAGILQARDDAVARGVIINGLAILGNEYGIDHYYQHFVIGGPGSFVVPVDSMAAMQSAVKRKLILEIASR